MIEHSLHGVSEERRLAYDESSRIPLVIRFPSLGRIDRGRYGRMVSRRLSPAGIDFVPNRFLTWAGRSFF